MRILLMAAVLLLSNCARDAWHAPMVVATDSSALLLPAVPTGKWKFTGPVNIVLQRGNNNVATTTATGKVKADAAATAPDAVATATTKKAGVPWWALVLVAVAGAALLAWLQTKFSFLR